MDVIQLRYFASVARLRSFSKAAAALNVSQPAITRQIRLLEAELGTQLLFRHSRGAEPTEAGLVLGAGAEAILRLFEQTRSEIIAQAAHPTGSIRIGFPPSIGNLLVGSTVSLYRARYPKVMVHLVEGFSHLLREWLLADRIDLAVMTSLEPHRLLVSEPLYEEDLWMLAPALPGRRRAVRSFGIEQLAKRPLIQTSRANSLRVLLEGVAADHGLALNVVVEADALPVIKDLVRQGVGVHASPYSAVIRDVESGAFSGGPIRGLAISRVIVRRIDRPVTRAVLEMTSLIRHELLRVAPQAGRSIRVAPALASGRNR